MIWEECVAKPQRKTTFKALIEDLNGRLIEERMISIDQDLLTELDVYYQRIRQAIRDKLEHNGEQPEDVASD